MDRPEGMIRRCLASFGIIWPAAGGARATGSFLLHVRPVPNFLFSKTPPSANEGGYLKSGRVSARP